jgi:hypothetical protein
LAEAEQEISAQVFGTQQAVLFSSVLIPSEYVSVEEYKTLSFQPAAEHEMSFELAVLPRHWNVMSSQQPLSVGFAPASGSVGLEAGCFLEEEQVMSAQVLASQHAAVLSAVEAPSANAMPDLPSLSL